MDRNQRASFARNIGVIAGSTAIGQAVMLLAMPLLTRLYSPSDFGVLGVYISIVLIGVAAAGLRYEFAIPVPKSQLKGACLLAASLSSNIIVSGIIVCGLAVVSEQLLRRLGAERLGPLVWFVGLGVLSGGVYQSLSYWAIRRRRFGEIAASKVSQTIAQVALQLILGFVIPGASSLLAGDAAGRAVGAGSFLRSVLKQDLNWFRRIRLWMIRSVARKYYRYPLFSCTASLFNSTGLHSPLLLLGLFYGPVVAGWFALGQRVVNLPVLLIGGAVGQVFTGEASELARGDIAGLRRLYSNTAIRLAALGVVPFLVIAGGGPILFSFIFGCEWRAAGYYSQTLSIAVFAQFVVVPVSMTLNIIGHQSWQMYWDIGRLALVVGALALAKYLGQSPEAAVRMYTVVTLISYVVLWLLGWTAIGKRQRDIRYRASNTIGPLVTRTASK